LKKYSDSDVDFYVIYGRENINSSQAQKSAESFVRYDCVKKRDCTRASATHTLDFQQVVMVFVSVCQSWGKCS